MDVTYKTDAIRSYLVSINENKQSQKFLDQTRSNHGNLCVIHVEIVSIIYLNLVP